MGDFGMIRIDIDDLLEKTNGYEHDNRLSNLYTIDIDKLLDDTKGL